MDEPLTPEKLVSIERDHNHEFMEPREGFWYLAKEIRKLWEERDELKRKVKEADERVYPTDASERDALRSDLTDKETQNKKLLAEVSDQYKQIAELEDKYEEAKETAELTGDKRLTKYLEVLEAKLATRCEEAAPQALEGIVSVHVLNYITIAYEMVITARNAYQAAVKDAQKVLEPENDN